MSSDTQYNPMATPQSTDSTKDGLLRRWVRWGFYPLALIMTVAYILAEVGGKFGSVGRAYPAYLFALIALMVVLERLIPMRPTWGMTRHLFFIRDLPMLAVNGTAIVATTRLLTWLARGASGLPLARLNTPWWAQALAALAMADFAWYWVHRYCHEGRGVLGRWMWRTHALHHLPEGVYVFMHAAGHPIQGVYVRVILMLPAILFGLSPEAVFAATVFNGFQGLVSHFNVDSRAGGFNRLFSGTELHRFHHSTDANEAKNYAAVLSIWDQVFGTYRLPGRSPALLGVNNREAYPANHEWLRLLALPFRRA